MTNTSEPDSSPKPFDVFLCHNSEDKPEIRQIAQDLESHGIRPWLDEEEIRPGTSWHTALGDQISSIKSAAVFVGQSGLGPWQNQEIQALLSQFTDRQCPVIPVILPSAKSAPDLPWTLKNLHMVDFRKNYQDPLKQLVWGITGDKPAEESGVSLVGGQGNVQEKNLLPPKDSQTIEIRLPGNLDDFSSDAKEKLLQSLSDLLDIGDVKLTRDPFPGSVRLHLELTPEDADKVYAAAKQGQLAELGIIEARLYTAIAEPPDEQQRSQLLILMDRVNEQWIKGVLRNSLFNEVLISLGKKAMDEAVEPPWKHMVELSGQRQHQLSQERDISTVFDATGLLLILGEPGSGKTTTLLELASDLISRVKGDPKERVPIVLNLSSWQNQQPLAEWIVIELSAKYRVPTKLARSWLQNDYIVPLLDGLDELPTTSQPDCVAAINEFVDNFKPSGLVVCCRLMEYQWLPERLKLNGAICLESLSSEEVDEFLARGGSQCAGLQKALSTDKGLQELSRTPLMLSIMSLAYQNRDVDNSELAEQQTDSPEERRDQIFELYVNQMFQRKDSSDLLFPKDKIIDCLSWMANTMQGHSQSVFMVEGLQPSWLGSMRQRVSYGILVALTIGLLVAMIIGISMVLGGASTFDSGQTALVFGLPAGLGIFLSCWSASRLKNGIICCLVTFLLRWPMIELFFPELRAADFWFFGMVFGIADGLIGSVAVGSLSCIPLVEATTWRWKQAWKMAIRTSCIAFLVSCLFLTSVVLVLRGEDLDAQDLMFVAINALIVGLFFGVVHGLIEGMVDVVKIDKASPNEGIKLSGRNAAIAFFIGLLVVGVFFGACYVLILGVIGELSLDSLEERLIMVLTSGGIGGLLVGLNRGGSTVIKHYFLRLILGLSGHTPFKFVGLLDQCAKLILLKKVGGGYIFIHRMLLEYFAELDSKAPPEKGAIDR